MAEEITMKISFVWKDKPPEDPPVDQIEASISFGLNHVGESRGPKPLALVVHLSFDQLARKVSGVGYSLDEKPLFISTFDLTTGVGTCDHYDALQKPQA